MAPLELGTSSSRSMGKELAPGVFGKHGVITAVTQHTDKQLGSYKPDLFLTFQIDSGGEFADEVDIFGSFKRDERTGEVLDWGGAFQVDRALKNIGAYQGLSDSQRQLTADNTIPASVMDNAVGKKVIYVLFAAGKHPTKDKLLWNTYPYLFEAINPDDDAENFQAILSDLSGSDYHHGKLIKGRDYMERTERRSSASPAQPQGAPAPSGNVPAGDDLPF